MRVLDVCTKYGTETQAFRDRGHAVVTLGIEGDVDIKQDVREFHTTEYYDVLFMCPPCTEFSVANNFKLGGWRERRPDMGVVNACLRLVDEIKPRYWIMENPAHGLRNFINHPVITIKYSDFGYFSQKKTDLWGVFPMSFLRFKTPNYNTTNLKRASPLLKRNTGHDRTENRSTVPYNLSLAFCLAIEKELGL